MSLPRREYELLAGMLARAVEMDVAGTAQHALRDAARALGANIASVVEGSSPAVIDVLVEIGYEPHVADDAIRLRNCPFELLARQHRDLVCGANLALIEGVVVALGAGAEQVLLDPGTDRCCVAVTLSGGC